jgi:hypothetical protein
MSPLFVLSRDGREVSCSHPWRKLLGWENGVTSLCHRFDLSTELYNGRLHNTNPATGYPVTFGTPTIFDGKVFAGARDVTNTSGIVDVWGLCSESPSGCLE